MEERKQKTKQEKKEELAGQLKVSTRGRIFKGVVTKKFPTRIVVEFEKTDYIPKYERYYKKKTRIHAYLPKGANVEVGDYVKVQECRPLSKIIHSIFIEKVSKEKQDVR